VAHRIAVGAGPIDGVGELRVGHPPWRPWAAPPDPANHPDPRERLAAALRPGVPRNAGELSGELGEADGWVHHNGFHGCQRLQGLIDADGVVDPERLLADVIAESGGAAQPGE